jgi:hypothetical protein
VVLSRGNAETGRTNRGGERETQEGNDRVEDAILPGTERTPSGHKALRAQLLRQHRLRSAASKEEKRREGIAW